MQLLIFKGVDLSLRYGNAPHSAASYSGYGFIRLTRGDIEPAYQFSQLAVRLQEFLEAPDLKTKVLYTHTRIIPNGTEKLL